MLAQCWFNVSPPSTTSALHLANVVSTPRVCWVSLQTYMGTLLAQRVPGLFFHMFGFHIHPIGNLSLCRFMEPSGVFCARSIGGILDFLLACIILNCFFHYYYTYSIIMLFLRWPPR